LSIQSNRLTKIEGLEELDKLEEIYLSHNAIAKIEGFQNNVRGRPEREKKLIFFLAQIDYY
jgi:protein phosphatase 1 regulatory subunit 7